jgi:serine/threonine-protein kinase
MIFGRLGWTIALESEDNQRKPDHRPSRRLTRLSPMTRRAVTLLSTLGLCGLAAVAWWALRQTLETRMSAAAQRGLETIVELVAADLRQLSAAPYGLKGKQLIEQITSANHELGATLRWAEKQQHRRVYFFDASGLVYPMTKPAAGVNSVAPPASEIVHLALAARRHGGERGARFEPYADLNRQSAVGLWRWLPGAELGIVAERPYDRFHQPIQWFDGAFAAFLALLLAAWLALVRQKAPVWRMPWPRSARATCGPYELLRPLGEGSMSTVHLARHRRLKRIVALKRLKPHAHSDELAARFDREVALASQLAHPNIITILDHGRAPGGGFYYTMEYIRGLTLGQWIDDHGPVPPARAVRLLRQLVAALAAMHERNLLHRDIKPDNVMAYAAHDDYDLVKLLDFGLIKGVDLEASRDLTRDVRILGTPAFMAPERLQDPRLVDPRTDLYGAGCIGYYLLTGRKPFEAKLETDMVQQILHVTAPLASSASPFPIPEPLDRLIADSLAKDITRRPVNARFMLRTLDELATSLPWSRDEARVWWRKTLPPADPERAEAAP